MDKHRNSMSPLSDFAHNAKAAKKKAIYTRALKKASEEQLSVLAEAKRLNDKQG